MIVVKHTIRCDQAGCGGSASAECSVGFGESQPEPRLPRGWTNIGRMLFCPDHVIVVKAKEDRNAS